eukprot:Hpha_TRINITY_DN15790_c3_g7::TRINITY_DN15790_c3_g7_i1::g.38499::m.38499
MDEGDGKTDEEQWRCTSYHSARALLLAATDREQGGLETRRYLNERRVLLRRLALARVASGAPSPNWPPPPPPPLPKAEPPGVTPQAGATNGSGGGGSSSGARRRRRGQQTDSASDVDGALIGCAHPGASRGTGVTPIRPAYLCEAALRDFLRYGAGGAAAQSTTRCSTITQDMDLGSSSQETPSVQEIDDWQEDGGSSGGESAKSDLAELGVLDDVFGQFIPTAPAIGSLATEEDAE